MVRSWSDLTNGAGGFPAILSFSLLLLGSVELMAKENAQMGQLAVLRASKEERKRADI